MEKLPKEVRCSGKRCLLNDKCQRTEPLPNNEIRMKISFMSPIYNYFKEECKEFIEK